MTLDKEMFMKRNLTLTENQFIAIKDIRILKACQRDTVTHRRFRKLKNLGTYFDPVRFGRVSLAKIDGFEELFIYDALGRTLVAACLGIEHVPCDIIHFNSIAEVLEVFFRQHDNEVKISGWPMFEVIYNAPTSMHRGIFKNKINQINDIFRVLQKTGCVYDDFKADESHPSVQSCLVRFRDCVTKEWSGNPREIRAGDRASYALIQSLEMIKRLWINNDNINVRGCVLAAIVSYSTKGGVYQADSEDVSRKSSDVRAIDSRLFALENKMRKFVIDGKVIEQKEFWSDILLFKNTMNGESATLGGPKIDKFVQSDVKIDMLLKQIARGRKSKRKWKKKS